MKKVLSLIAFSIIAVSAQEYQQQQEQQQVIPQQQQEYQQQPQQVYPPQQQQIYQQPQQAYPPQQQIYQQPQQQAYPPQQQIYQQPQQQQQNVTQEQSQQEKKVGFGVRAAWGLVNVSGDNYKKVNDGGFSIGGGVFTLQDFNFAMLNGGLFIAYKKTLAGSRKDDDEYGSYSSEMKATEIALEIPVLFRYPISNKFYVEAGPQINLAFAPEWEQSANEYGEKFSESYDYDDRNFIDFGVTVGAGFNIIEKLSIDARLFYGIFTDFADKSEGTLWQITFGANYLF